jgi:hypothetical protein
MQTPAELHGLCRTQNYRDSLVGTMAESEERRDGVSRCSPLLGLLRQPGF